MRLLRCFTLAILVVLAMSLIVVRVTIPQAEAQSAVGEAHLTFTTIDVPGAAVTEVNGINTAGDMVGFYGQSTSGDAGGFLYHDGAFSYFNYPGLDVTVPNGMNDSGVIVGYATQVATQRFSVVGFLYDGNTFTTLRDGSNSATYGYAINSAGVVVGSAGSLGTTKGFELRNGRYHDIDFPGSYVYGFAAGVNDHGVVVGSTDNAAFAYKTGTFRGINFPGAQQTVALGINDDGVVVGWYAIPSGCLCGFAAKNGRYISFGYPGAKFTYASGINKAGQIVGSYSSDNLTYHGFVSTPIVDTDFEGR